MDNPDDLGQVLGLGEHCSVDHCRQVDFLPFKCDCCSRIFCLEHRSYRAHLCPNAGAKETTVIVCPICAKSVRLAPGQDANSAFDAHQRTDCDPANYERVHKKPRCPVGGCKEKLTTVNAYRCKNCNQRVCLRHRDPGDHRCAEAQAALRSQRGAAYTAADSRGPTSKNNSAASSRPSSAPRAAAGNPSAAPAAAAAATSAPARRLDPQQRHVAAVRQYEDPANSLHGTAARRRAMLEEQQQQQQQQQQRWPWQQPKPGSNSGSNANPLIPPQLPERCPQCGASFATVERLIQHVEDFHPTAATAAGAPPSAGVTGPGTGRGTTFNAGAPAAAAAAAPGVGPVFTNPLRGLLSGTTIAGGEAPVGAAAAAGVRQAGSGAGGAGASGEEVYRCHLCSRTFHDPVLLVQHADRCSAANGAAAAAAGRLGAGRGGAGGGDASRDCVIS